MLQVGGSVEHMEHLWSTWAEVLHTVSDWGA